MSHRITKIERVDLTVRRPAIGCNSQTKEMPLPEPGWVWEEPIVRLTTEEGLVGWGHSRAEPDDGQFALGREVEDLLDPAAGVADELRPVEFPLWDLLGQVRQKPVWALLGGSQRPEGVPAYDSTLYFNDLLHETADEGLARIEEDVEQAVARGFRAFKMKLGRGNHLMSRPEGMIRDRVVVRRAREVAGPPVDIMVDANNAYTLEEALDFADATGDLNLFWMEEMFEETLEDCRALHNRLRIHGLPTLVADGETRSHEPLEFWEPFFEAGVVDVIQHDTRTLGFTGWRKLAGLANQYGVRCAPHNWGSLLGLFMTVQLGLAIPNLLFAEVATLESDVIDWSAYRLVNGKFQAPELPGLGLGLLEEIYQRRYAHRTLWALMI